jgi:hypothetical protein
LLASVLIRGADRAAAMGTHKPNHVHFPSQQLKSSNRADSTGDNSFISSNIIGQEMKKAGRGEY